MIVDRFGVTLTAALVCTAGASGAITTLSDANSVIRVDDGSQAGLFDWTVDGVDQLYQQWFWFRTSSMGQELSVDTMPLTGFSVSDTNPFDDPGLDSLSLRYTGPEIEFTASWTLRGGTPGSAISDLSESLSIKNVSANPVTLTFFQYSDFDLGGTVPDAWVEVSGITNNTISQKDIGFFMSETIVTPSPDNWEVNFFPTTLSSLNDLAITTLNNNNGPIGPGDLTWAVSWNLTLNPGQAVTVVKDKSVVPTPGAAVLLGFGAVAAVRRRR